MHVSKHTIGSFIFYLITVSQLINYIYYNHSFFRNIQRYFFFFPIFAYYALFIYLFICLLSIFPWIGQVFFYWFQNYLFQFCFYGGCLLLKNLRPKLISTYVYWFLKLTILMLFCLSACILNFSKLVQNGSAWLACVYFLSSFLWLYIGLFWQWKCGALTTGPPGKSLP